MVLPGLISAPALIAGTRKLETAISYIGFARIYGGVTSSSSTVTVSSEGQSVLVAVCCAANSFQQRTINSCSVGGIGGTLIASNYNTASGVEYSGYKAIYVVNGVSPGSQSLAFSATGSMSSYGGQAIAYECNQLFASTAAISTIATSAQSGTLTIGDNGIYMGCVMYRAQTGDNGSLSPMGNQVVIGPVTNEPNFRAGCSVTTSDGSASVTSNSGQGGNIGIQGLVAASWNEDNFA